MSDINFNFNGLSELMEEFKEAEKRVPDLSEKALKKGMNKVKKLSKEKTPYRDKPKKHTKNKSKKHIRDSYKILPIEYESNGMNIKMTNKSPHYHLIEKGHRLVTKNGREIGFVPGQHMVERSMAEMEEEFPKQIEKMIKKILR